MKRSVAVEPYLSPVSEVLYLLLEQTVLDFSQLESGSEDEGWGNDNY